MTPSTVAESTLAVQELLGLAIVSDLDRVLLERAFRFGYERAYSEETLFYYCSYHYAYKIKKAGLSQAQSQLVRITTDTYSMRVKIGACALGHDKMGSSTDGYFFSRMETVFEAVDFVISHRMTELFSPVAYLLFNMQQTLCLYLASGDTSFIEKAKDLSDRVAGLVTAFLSIPEVRTMISRDLSLATFCEYQAKLRAQLIDVPYEWAMGRLSLTNLPWRRLLRVLLNLADLDSDQFRCQFEACLSRLLCDCGKLSSLESAIALRVACRYCAELEEPPNALDLGLTEAISGTTISDSLSRVFLHYDESHAMTVCSDDMARLNSMNDAQLRQALAKVVNTTDRRLARVESGKPHTGYEVSDMDIPVLLNGRQYYLCLPIKSAREIRTETVPVDVFHQIAKPLLTYDNCMVAFVSAKRCSEPLQNLVKSMVDRGCLVTIVQEHDLAALLKVNNALP